MTSQTEEPPRPFQFTCKDCGDHVVSYIRYGYDRKQCSLCHYISCIPDEETRNAMRVVLQKSKTVCSPTPEVRDGKQAKSSD